MFSLAVFVSAMLDPRPSRSGAAAGRAHSDDGCDHLSYARARPRTIGSSLFALQHLRVHRLSLCVGHHVASNSLC